MTVWVGSLPLGGRVLVGVPESKKALRWEESKISGAAAGRCRKSPVGRERKKVNRWEERSGSISATGG